ncbi:DUF1376 domain-containing protein [Pseudomonas sp. DWP3-1-2]|uniref:DUF1376 domain-containing protein n=1 Tax=Pseudomonas sp. DWP3-1-2 TaxID=2804645 RepID=UPI003CF34F56
MTAAELALPDPLVPAAVDLAGMAFMPLDVSRLLDSDLFALSTGEEFKAAVALWCKSWTQVPGGSLPNNDRVLAHLSGAGARWPKVKEQALHGWTLCSDGRLYHAVIAEKALIAWGERLVYIDRQAADAERKRAHREEAKGLRAQLAQHGIGVAWNETVSAMRGLLQKLPQTCHTDSDGEGDAPVQRTGLSPATDLSPTIKREVKVKVKVLDQEHVLQRDAPNDADIFPDAPLSEQGETHSVITLEPVQPALAMVQPGSTRQAKAEVLAGFARFYGLYPKRQKRAEAEKAWLKLSPSPELQATILAALAQHVQQGAWLRDGGQFVPLPASWLNARRWEDELEVSTGEAASPAGSIVEIYHEFCPDFDPVTVLDDTLRGMLDERWREHDIQQNLDFWRDFFNATKGLGQIFYRGQNRKPYLEALVSRQNFRDIVEGRNHA